MAAWPVACLVLAGLLLAGWFGWHWADGVTESRASEQAGSCPEGDTTVRVAVDPTVRKPVTTAATRWNGTHPVVRDSCVRVRVHAAPTGRVLDVLLDRAPADTLGSVPAAWVPSASTWADRLTGERPDRVGSSPVPLATGPDGATHPYLALAGDGLEPVHEHAAQSFHAFLRRPAQLAEFEAAGLVPVRN